MASVNSFGRALNQLTVRSLRSGSGRDVSIWGQHSAVGDGVRSGTPRSGDNCQTLNPDHRSGSGYSETRTGTAGRELAVYAVQLSHAFEFRESIVQPELESCSTPLDSHLSEDASGLGQPRFAISVLIVTALLMTAPSLIAGITMLNSSFDLSYGWSKQASDLSLGVSCAGLLVAIALALMVWKSPREQ